MFKKNKHDLTRGYSKGFGGERPRYVAPSESRLRHATDITVESSLGVRWRWEKRPVTRGTMGNQTKKRCCLGDLVSASYFSFLFDLKFLSQLRGVVHFSF